MYYILEISVLVANTIGHNRILRMVFKSNITVKRLKFQKKES